MREAAPPDESAVIHAIPELTGDISQVPPAFSAKHVEGQRAYKLARKGVPADLKPAHVRVDRWAIIEHAGNALRVRITCGSGTYIRALARDLGRLTHSAAHCAELRRVRCGPFSVTDAVLPDAVTAGDLRPALMALAGLPAERIDAAAALGVAHGRPAAATVAGDWAALVTEDTELLAVAQREGTSWHPRIVLRDPQRPAPSA
jgi:tRNA pseudouridine55 synthase